MVYYMEKAPELKKEVERLEFSAEQMNVIQDMMKACRVLRQNDPIERLWRACCPDNVEFFSQEVEGKYGKYNIQKAIPKEAA